MIEMDLEMDLVADASQGLLLGEGSGRADHLPVED